MTTTKTQSAEPTYSGLSNIFYGLLMAAGSIALATSTWALLDGRWTRGMGDLGPILGLVRNAILIISTIMAASAAVETGIFGKRNILVSAAWLGWCVSLVVAMDAVNQTGHEFELHHPTSAQVIWMMMQNGTLAMVALVIVCIFLSLSKPKDLLLLVMPAIVIGVAVAMQLQPMFTAAH